MFYLILATVCFSLSFGLIKNQLAVLPTELVVLCRLFIATIIFLPFFRNLKSKKHFFAGLIGIIQFGVMYLCFIRAFKYLQGNEIALLTTTTPVFVAIWSAVWGEKFKPVYIFCILMSVVGAGVVVWYNISFDMIIKGVILMETSNCSFALGQVLWKKFIGENDINIMSSAYLGATLFVLPFVLFDVNISAVHFTMMQIFSILYLSIIPTGIGFWLWNKGASKVKYSTLAIMNNFKIPLGIFFAIVLFHEKIDFVNFLIGSSIILTAIFILQFVLKHDKN